MQLDHLAQLACHRSLRPSKSIVPILLFARSLRHVPDYACRRTSSAKFKPFVPTTRGPRQYSHAWSPSLDHRFAPLLRTQSAPPSAAEEARPLVSPYSATLPSARCPLPRMCCCAADVMMRGTLKPCRRIFASVLRARRDSLREKAPKLACVPLNLNRTCRRATRLRALLHDLGLLMCRPRVRVYDSSSARVFLLC